MMSGEKHFLWSYENWREMDWSLRRNSKFSGVEVKILELD
jgi:hypothetical protein